MIEVNNKAGAKISEGWINKVGGQILRGLKIDKKMIVSVALVDDREIRSLNKKYRNKNEVTDVLSFSNLEGGEMILPEGERYLGEVIIGYDQARRQAKEQGHSLEKELAILLIHGGLHLLGYEHEGNIEKAKNMRKKEAELLNMFSSNCLK